MGAWKECPTCSEPLCRYPNPQDRAYDLIECPEGCYSVSVEAYPEVDEDTYCAENEQRAGSPVRDVPNKCPRCDETPKHYATSGYKAHHVLCDNCYDGVEDSSTRHEFGEGDTALEATHDWNGRVCQEIREKLPTYHLEFQA